MELILVWCCWKIQFLRGIGTAIRVAAAAPLDSWLQYLCAQTALCTSRWLRVCVRYTA